MPSISGSIRPARSAAKLRTQPTTIASVPIAHARRVAAAACPLLLTGETGVGKGWLAEWVHGAGPRSRGPFIPVNCAALPESLIDAQLFGHERGAFTDARKAAGGLVREAEGGSLFLDEVGDLPMAAQARLLRLLEEREIQPVGAAMPVRVNVRVIAATGRDLATMVTAGSFRADLYYRLEVIRFHLQPLRRRRDEIPGLVDRLVAEFCTRLGRTPLRFAPDAATRLRRHAWPGNVRELRSVIERLAVLLDDELVTAEDLERLGRLAPATPVTPRASADPRLAAARRAVGAHGGSISRAADALGVHRSTLHRWLARASA